MNKQPTILGGNTEHIWDHLIQEIEVDATWRDHPIYKSKEHIEYRDTWEKARKGEELTDFPLNIEIEPTYYCNLQCPYCPRYVHFGERKIKGSHMSQELFTKIIEECKENKMPAMQYDHEAEPLMHPNFFNMLKQASEAGIFDEWLHTNGQMLNEKNSTKLIDNGLKKINISVDAFKEETYEKLRVGGKLKKLIENIHTFLKVKKEKKADYLRVRISMVEQKENFSEKRDFYEYWSKQKGVNTITFQKCEDYTRFEKVDPDKKLSEKELDEKYKKVKPFFCSQPWQTPAIENNGKVAPCLKPIREHNKYFYMGDLSKGQTIKEIWNGSKFKKLRELHKTNQWYKNDMCRVCVNGMRTAEHEDFEVKNY